MNKKIVVTTLALGMIGGYLGGSHYAEASAGLPLQGRYAPTMSTAPDGSVRHFCVTDTVTGDTVCTEGFVYDYCLDERGNTSTECTLPVRKFYVLNGPRSRL